jgi:integrase/recombinase XerC
MSAADNRSLVDSYLDNLRTQRKLADHTVSNYGRDLEELLIFSEPIVKDASFAAVTHFHVRKFAAQLHSRGLNARSIARKLSCWRGFFDWLPQQGINLTCNPVDGVKAPKRAKPLPKALSADDAVHLVAHAAPGQRVEATMQRCNRAMFELLYSSGLRVSELVGLDLRYTKEGSRVSLGWIDFDAHEVTVTGKGGKMRSVPIGSAAISALAEWLAVRTTLIKTDATSLFLSERGTRMSVRVVQLRLKAHAQALGIPSDVHPHVLRHSFASHVLQSSGDLRAVQEMLGHASIAATQVYTSLDFQRLAQVYDAAHPRAKKQIKGGSAK